VAGLACTDGEIEYIKGVGWDGIRERFLIQRNRSHDCGNPGDLPDN